MTRSSTVKPWRTSAPDASAASTRISSRTVRRSGRRPRARSDRALGGARLPGRRQGQGQSRPAGVAEPAGVAVGPFRLVVLSAQPVQLTELVVGGVGRHRMRHGGQAPARTVRLLHGVRPVSVQTHDLDPVDEADTPVGHLIVQVRAPPGHLGGPLAGPAEVEHLVAGGDDRAVRQPRHDRGHLARGDRDHGLVEEADPGPLLPELDEHSPMETMEKFCRSASAYRVAMVSACSETARERTKSPAE